MKKLVIIIMLSAFAISVTAQKLIDLYKKGTVRLIPDTEYAKDNNWDDIFKDYYETLHTDESIKSLIVLPDGSVIVNHTNKDYYTKFSSNGKFEKEFGIKDNNGELFKKVRPIKGIINKNIFFTSLDNMGKMICFDFNGNYIKTLKLDYMTRQIIPLPNNKIAVVGWVIRSSKFRDFVAIVDYESNEQKVIWEHLTNTPETIGHYGLFHYGYKFNEHESFSLSTMPYTKYTGLSSPPQISCVRNILVIALPSTGEILLYDFAGNLKSKEKINWETNFISVEEQKEIQQGAINYYKSIKNPNFSNRVTLEENKLALESIIKYMEADLDKISDPISYPAFSTLIKDSDENLLFFEHPNEINKNKFNVWILENNGKFVCQSSFVCDECDLIITPSRFVFHNGYIYGLQIFENSPGVPLRLVRFKITSE